MWLMPRLDSLRVAMLFAGALMLAGCASGPRYSEVESRIPSLAEGHGRIFVYRAGAMGFGLRPDVMLNGEVAGRSVAEGFFFVDRPPGEYRASATTEVEHSVTFDLAAGQTVFVRSTMELGVVIDHVKLALVDAAQGRGEIATLKYTGDDAALMPR